MQALFQLPELTKRKHGLTIRPAAGVPLDYGCGVMEAEGVGKFGSHSWLFHYPINGENIVFASWQDKPLARLIHGVSCCCWG
jgi:hypothetical protein